METKDMTTSGEEVFKMIPIYGKLMNHSTQILNVILIKTSDLLNLIRNNP